MLYKMRIYKKLIRLIYSVLKAKYKKHYKKLRKTYKRELLNKLFIYGKDLLEKFIVSLLVALIIKSILGF